MRVRELFCAVDDFCQAFAPKWQQHCMTTGSRHRYRRRDRALREIMTILILCHQAHYRTFNACSTEHVCEHLRAAFPGLVSSTRFGEFFPSTLVPLCVSPHMLWCMYGRLVCRFDQTGRVSQPPDSAASCLPWHSRTRQDVR